MLDLSQLEQLAAFERLGTLAKVAEEFHISTPSVTRSMQRLEESFGAPLFVRGKNRLELTETGKLAAEYSRRLLREADDAVSRVRAFEARRRTIVVRSCAPAPLWELLHLLSEAYPERTLASDICRNEEVQAAWESGACDAAILPFPTEGARPFMEEHLFVCVPPEHELARHSSLTFSEINGFNFLLRSELGFWDVLCHEKMPASKFLVQTDPAVFDELVRASSLPCFTTDYGQRRLMKAYPGRVNLPLTDREANVVFYLSGKKTVQKILPCAKGRAS